MKALARASAWLRIAAVIAALYAAGHTAGRPWTPTHDGLAQGVVVGMREVHFSALGTTRSYWEFYQGFGLALSVLLAMEAVLLWQLAAVARAGTAYRAMTVTHLVGFLVLGAVASRFIFALPLWLSLAIAACLAVALSRPQSREATAGPRAT
ncbi:MAG TPA: hypothetical protein VLV29_09575 [Steroidobacteraceae bacterium]|nr:hypothetical protein [Steroidobacteraceae bacterium]